MCYQLAGLPDNTCFVCYQSARRADNTAGCDNTGRCAISRDIRITCLCVLCFVCVLLVVLHVYVFGFVVCVFGFVFGFYV